MESHGHGVTPLTGKRGGNFVKHRFVQLQQQQQQQLVALVGKYTRRHNNCSWPAFEL